MCDPQDSADETNGSPLHENGGDTAGSFSDAGTGTPPQESGGTTTPTTTNIPLGDNSLLVDISDALSEKDKVKFTVHTRTKLPGYAKDDFFVVRQHEEFVWLHDRFEENEDYAGYIVSLGFCWAYFGRLLEMCIYEKICSRFHHVLQDRTLMLRGRSCSGLARERAT